MADQRLRTSLRLYHAAGALDVVVATAVLTAATAMAFEFGFYPHALPLPLKFLQGCQFAAAAAFLAEVALRRPLAEGRRDWLSRWWAELAVAATAVAAALLLAARALLAGRGADLPGWLLVLAQLYLAAVMLLKLLRVNMALARSRIHPARLLVASFLSLILVGAGALKLPRATPPPVIGERQRLSWTDALFTATSAVCVTGLVVRPTGSDQRIGQSPAQLADRDLPEAGFTRFGQAVILVLIQLGGLGIMIVGTVFAVMLGRQMSLRHSLVVSDMLSSQTVGRIATVVRFLFIVTFSIEAVGAALLYSMWSDFDWPVTTRLFYAVFHSVSAFCNAGFSLTPDSLVRYHGYWQVHCVIAPLIVIGGLGFPVLLDLTGFATDRIRRLVRLGRPPGRRPQLALHTRIVLATTALLILLGAAGLLLLEPASGAAQDNPIAASRVGRIQPNESDYQLAAESAARTDPHRLREERTGQALADAVFMSVTARTAGFNTVSTDQRDRALGPGSQFLLVVLMTIGGSPASTAGGLKTATLAVLALTVVSVVRRRDQVEAFKRSLGADVVKRAATLAFCFVALVCLTTLALTVTEAERGASFLSMLFESASACGTVGLSTGLTGDLTQAGRCVIIVAMFAGRLGPLTMLIALAFQGRRARYELPAESVVLG